MLVCQPLGWLPRHDAPPTLPRKQYTSKLPSRLHRPLNFCESAGYGERCILHASFTPFAGIRTVLLRAMDAAFKV